MGWSEVIQCFIMLYVSAALFRYSYTIGNTWTKTSIWSLYGRVWNAFWLWKSELNSLKYKSWKLNICLHKQPHHLAESPHWYFRTLFITFIIKALRSVQTSDRWPVPHPNAVSPKTFIHICIWPTDLFFNKCYVFVKKLQVESPVTMAETYIWFHF